jgi:tetratricopeptide (TPR) repeat protein
VITEKAKIKYAEFIATEIYVLAKSLLDEGRIEDARDILRNEIRRLPAEETDHLLAYRNLLASVERGAKNFYEALRIHTETHPLAELSHVPILRARFHNGLGITLEEIACRESLRDYFDRALIEYEAARYHAEEAGDTEFAGHIENNIALVYCQLGETAQAHEHLAHARTYFQDKEVKLAEIDETEAQVSMKEAGKEFETLTYALSACNAFIRHGEKRLLDDALPTLLKAIADYRCAVSADNFHATREGAS